MSENRKLKVFLPLLFALVLALGMYLGHKMPAARNSDSAIFFNNRRGSLQEVMDLLKYKYVDTLDLADAQEEAIEGLLSHLDPHSVYIPPANVQEVNEDLDGNFEGIGVEFNIIRDTVNILNVISGGPSDAAGVLTGDKILAVDDSIPVAGRNITPDKIRKLLRGPRNSIVKTKMLRGNKELDVIIKRGVIPLYSIDASYMTAPATGYIKISKFSATTYTEFMEAMRKLQKQGMKNLVIDLRQNGGGFLDAAVRLADELLEDNLLIVYTQGKSYPRQDYKSTRPGLFEKGGLSILLDEGSASASEVLAGAIQDHDRGTIVGRRSFGKGLVQEPFDLSNGATLRLTIARYYLPSGRSIQKSYQNGREAYEEDIANRYSHGEFLNRDSIHPIDTVPYKTDKGRTVYGGGGIMPDIFIPFDTTRYSALLTDLYTRNVFGDFVYEYYTAHAGDFSSYKDAESFNRQFHTDDALLQAFRAHASRMGIAMSGMNAKDELEIRTRLKALLARQLWRSEGFYMVINSMDPVISRAVEELNKTN
ncbi:S41 family peptidase [Chitinophaga sp. XS-30]|uniref:S41 family peptidase n=1 Tax=Chitinophaga sp. XS-30 TaxID=2604421 RepID=UPI0011DE55BE|nr:S41 family peptidase [Chitinophaga sp. XS-30]QEH41052.1 S41 family peptidase [Chitinophaga sp. XS-30]